MAEFEAVFSEWKRMCLYYREHYAKCEKCPLNDLGCDRTLVCRQNYHTPKQIQAIIMQWAKEHPEPVYPRWCDWLAEIGVLVCDNTYPNMRYWYAINKDRIEQSIPADIAEKLGLKPEET